MKINEKKKSKKSKGSPKPVPKAKVLIVAQELKFARLLAGNEKKSRDRVLKSLKKWLGNCFEKKYEFKEEDFIRVWKGLFYAVWMSDKPLIQEELCESISAILDQFPTEQYGNALLMYKAGLRVLATEWYGLDQHRIDKFLMLVRRLLRASLRCVALQQWSLEACKRYSDALTEDSILSVTTPSFARNALSLMLHICDCFLEELSKVTKGKLPPESLAALLQPFVAYTCSGQELRGCVASRRVLTQLLRQSEVGVAYEEKRRAWEQMGCPEGGPDALEVASDDESDAGDQSGDGSDLEDQEACSLDPRAGRGDVVLHSLPVPAKELAKELRARLRTARGRGHTRAKICLQRFEQFASQHYPLRVTAPVTLPAGELRTPGARAAARKLERLERKLKHDTGRAAMRGLSRKHRKRLLAKSREGVSIVDELAALRTKTASQTNGKWQVEETQPPTSSEDSSNKENVNKNGKKTKKRKTSLDSDNSPSKKQKVEENKPKVLVNGKDKKSKVKSKDSSPKSTKTASVNATTKKSEKLKITITDSDTKAKPDKAKIKQQLLSLKAKKEQKPTVTVNKVKNFQKQTSPARIEKKSEKKTKKTEENSPAKGNSSFNTPKKLKFVLKNNSMQSTMDYYKSVRQSPNIPFDGQKQPTKTNLKPNSTPSPINPFFKKKLRMRV